MQPVKVNGPLLLDYLRFIGNKEAHKDLLGSLFLRNGKVIGLYTACHILEDLMEEEGPLVDPWELTYRIRTYAADVEWEIRDQTSLKQMARLRDEVTYLRKAVEHVRAFVGETRHFVT